MARIIHPPFFLAAINRLAWYFRWPIKWALFGIAYVMVCFPYPNLVFRHLRHWSNPNALIEPNAPSLQPLALDLRKEMAQTPDLPPPEVLNQVEAFVYRRVPYDWDWNTWGMADYLPTVDEVIRMGREDCDGRAVVAASLLKNLGYDARIVTDFAHVWVVTPYGETMGPGKTKTIEVTDKGMRFNARGLTQIPQILSYGIAVFPLSRELVLLVVAWILLLGWAGFLRTLFSIVLLTGGLLLLRYGAADYRGPRLTYELAGSAVFAVGVLFLVVRSKSLPQQEKTATGGNAL